MRELLALIATCGVLVTAGCNRTGTSQYSSAKAGMPIMADYSRTTRFIAERHRLDIVAPESELPAAWQSVVSYCGTLRCEVLSSSITAKTHESVPIGSVSLRIVPDDLNKLLAQVAKQGTVILHTTESQDKTADVVDTEAKIKNLSTFRDNLRSMLAKPATTVKDSVEIQKQLTDVQAELDYSSPPRSDSQIGTWAKFCGPRKQPAAKRAIGG